jgi:hypothetical protein
METLSDIIFEQIDEVYARGRYGEFEVTLVKKNSYINATKLSTQGGKQFKHWLENSSSKRLIEAVAHEIATAGNPADGHATFLVTGGTNTDVRGTYVHPLLVPHIACWISTTFAIKVSKLVNEAMAREFRLSIRAKDDKIDELMAQLAVWQTESRRDMADVKSELVGVKAQNVESTTKLTEVNAKLGSIEIQNAKSLAKVDALASIGQDAITKIDAISTQLDNVARDLVTPPSDDSKSENLAIFKTSGRAHNYRFACLNSANLKRESSKVARATPPETVILALRCVPNATSLYHNLVESLGARIEMERGGGASKRFKLVDITEAELLSLAHAEHVAPRIDCSDLAMSAKTWGLVAKRTITTTTATTEIIPLNALSEEDLAELLEDLW